MKELFQKVIGFFKGIFKSQQAPAVASKPDKESKPKRTYNKQKRQDFGELLDNLDATFSAIKLPNMKESWLDRDSMIGLKKLGVHVPNPWAIEWTDDLNEIFLDVSKPLPALMCISIPTREVNKEKIYPKFIFAIKYKKLPWHVAYHPGAPYLFGAAFDLNGNLFWMHMYLTVNRKTGAMTCCEELQAVRNVIKVNGKRPNTYISKQWKEAAFLQDDKISAEQIKNSVMNLMRGMHNWWIGRDERWNVIIKKNGDRLTFGVDNKDTPYFFKNRDKVVTEKGQTKRIVHYVKEHDRTRNGKTNTIKEHVRGLQEFNWNGYQCKVISPKLNVKTSATFAAEPKLIEDVGAEDMVYLSKVGKMLADFEERKTA